MSEAVTADQLDLITDDPRREAKKSPLAILRELTHARETYGELITPTLAARVLDVSRQHLDTWMRRGRLTRVEIGQCVFVPAQEIEVLYEERRTGEVTKIPGQKKLPSLAEVIKLSQKAE